MKIQNAFRFVFANVGMALSVIVFSQPIVFAEAASPSVQEEIQALKDRIAELEKRSATPTTTETSAGSELKSYSSSNSVITLLKDVKLSGYVDSTYNYNFNSPSNNINVGRVFDQRSDTFRVNAAKIVFQKETAETSPVGFRVDMLAGKDAQVIHSAGLGDSNDSFDLEQAYAEVRAPLSKLGFSINDLTIKAGKFVSLAGAEVIESKDNYNISRSYMFGYAVPFTHTGVRTTYTWDNGWDLALGINNGWDNTDDNNNSKTFEGHIGFNNIALPGDSTLTLALQGYTGSEAANKNGANRTLGDFIATYKTPWKPLTLVYNFDYAREEDASAYGDNAIWYGHAGYARIDFSDDWSFSLRGEYFKDEDGVRIVSGTPANYRAFTGTLEYRPWSNIITRLEYRNDHASEDVFNDEDTGLTDTQNTISGQMIVTF